MPTFAAVNINDGQAAPAAHTFAPLQKEGGVATFVDRSPSITPGWRKIKHEVVSATQQGAANRVKISINDPVLGTVDSQTVVLRNSSATITLNYAQNATDQEKKDLHAYCVNYLSNATVKAGIIALEPFY